MYATLRILVKNEIQCLFIYKVMEDLRFKQVNLYSPEGKYFKSILCSEYEKIINYYNNDSRLERFKHLSANYFQANSRFRSLLLYYGTGVGKTPTACSVINNISTFSKDMNLVIILPAALKPTWIHHFRGWVRNKHITDKAAFISVDSPNFVNEFDLTTKSLTFNVPTLFIIDECHLFISSLTEETSARKIVYFQLLELINNYNSYLLCLSATPIVNKVEEVVYLFNLLRANTFHFNIEIFNRLFINEINGQIQNHNIFARESQVLSAIMKHQIKKVNPSLIKK